jgi:hypothetical protein
MITKEQLEAIIKAVDEGGDGDDEISEEEVIAILRDHAPGEIPFIQEMFAWERSRNRPHCTRDTTARTRTRPHGSGACDDAPLPAALVSR